MSSTGQTPKSDAGFFKNLAAGVVNDGVDSGSCIAVGPKTMATESPAGSKERPARLKSWLTQITGIPAPPPKPAKKEKRDEAPTPDASAEATAETVEADDGFDDDAAAEDEDEEVIDLDAEL